MTPHEVEKLVLGICLAYPNGKENIPQRICHELELSRFGDAANAHIYQAIKECIVKGITPNTANVAVSMNGTLDASGGIEYIESLQRFPALLGVYDTSGLPTWVSKVDLNGRARAIHQILNKKIGMPLNDFQEQVSQSEDGDAFLSQLTLEVNQHILGTKSGYRPFSDAVDQFLYRAKLSLQGEVTEVIPCGIPNLEKYCIPRPRSFGVISGISGQGKTAFAVYIGIGVAIQLAKRGETGHVAISTYEQPGERIAQRVACMMARVNSLDIAQGRIDNRVYDRLVETCEYIKTLPIRYVDDPSITSKQFVTQAIIENLSDPRRMGIVDYVELFPEKSDSEELKISNATRNIRTVCWETGSCEIMISQVNDSAIKNSYGIGGLFSSRYSRSPAHAADWYIEIVNYPQMFKAQMKPSIPDGKSGDRAYALIEKNKDYPIGEEPFEWIDQYTLFRDVSLPMNQLYAELEKEPDF